MFTARHETRRPGVYGLRVFMFQPHRSRARECCSRVRYNMGPVCRILEYGRSIRVDNKAQGVYGRQSTRVVVLFKRISALCSRIVVYGRFFCGLHKPQKEKVYRLLVLFVLIQPSTLIERVRLNPVFATRKSTEAQLVVSIRHGKSTVYSRSSC